MKNMTSHRVTNKKRTDRFQGSVFTCILYEYICNFCPRWSLGGAFYSVAYNNN